MDTKKFVGVYQRPTDIPKQPLCDKVEAHIRWQILNGIFVGGDKIREQVIAHDMNVSRTVVREATRRLFGAGLVEIDSQRGVFVKIFSIEQINDLIDVRLALSQLTARLFVERSTSSELKMISDIFERIRNVNEDNFADSDYITSLQFFEVFLRSTQNERVYFLDREAWQQMRVFKLFLEHRIAGEIDVSEFNRMMFLQGTKNRMLLFDALSEKKEKLIFEALQQAALKSKQRAYETYQKFLGHQHAIWSTAMIKRAQKA